MEASDWTSSDVNSTMWTWFLRSPSLGQLYWGDSRSQWMMVSILTISTFSFCKKQIIQRRNLRTTNYFQWLRNGIGFSKNLYSSSRYLVPTNNHIKRIAPRLCWPVIPRILIPWWRSFDKTSSPSDLMSFEDQFVCLHRSKKSWLRLNYSW
jgi:hypothetical protein